MHGEEGKLLFAEEVHLPDALHLLPSKSSEKVDNLPCMATGSAGIGEELSTEPYLRERAASAEEAHDYQERAFSDHSGQP